VHFSALLAAVTILLHGAKNWQLRWPDLDLERGSLRLAVTKNTQGRAVPVTGLALTLLRQHAQKPWSPWVFPRRDGVKAVLIDHAWRQAVRRAALRDFRFHDLRHTAASYLAMSGASLREIADVLGHTNIQRTLKYAHLVASHTARVVARMTTQFLPAHPGQEGGCHD
jgi:integrase